MRYEPIKEKIGSAIGTNHTMRKLYYFGLGIMLLRSWHVKREIRRIFKTDGFTDVLDAGCGPGEYSYYLAKKFSAKVTGVDIIQSEVDRCNRFAQDQKLSNAKFVVADLSSNALPGMFDYKFDLIVSVDVMEHIKDDAAVFKNFSSVLREGGKVIISTPSAGTNHGEEHSTNLESESFIDEHFRDGYSPQDISEKLKAANLKVERIIFTYGFGGNIYWKLVMKAPITLLNKSSVYFLLLPFYYIITFPVSLLFMALDYFLPPKGGGGLLVVACKAHEGEKIKV
ncbi:MAG TPA: class I SAM-dependent methyltransferase [Candidatus Acidoferrales bacterium]|nr:class I SAM-dependent methyltransferase [Candidatus Acidoferrales bacterium]